MIEEAFFQVLQKRRSIRSFKSKEIEEFKISKIIESCDLAPSAGGLQSFEIYAVKGNDKRNLLAKAALDQMFISEAPLVLLFCANASRSVGKYADRSVLYSIQDATIAAVYAQLAAQALGLASAWVGAFDENKVSEALGLPGNHEPVAIIPIGYPDETPFEKITRGSRNLLRVVR
jgi:nitroreductase